MMRNLKADAPERITKLCLGFSLLVFSNVLLAQTGYITGTAKDKNTQEPLAGVSIVLVGTDPLIGASSDNEGKFKLTAPAGSYNIKGTYIGYKPMTKFNIVVTSGNINEINFELEEEQLTMSELVVQGNTSAAVATWENPLSIQRLTTEEIRSNPGGNFDISRVIQTLPGVGGSTASGSFRNDIIIRGGAPNENIFYLDGIEIPVINHFTTQGSTGGPQGMLNVSFIEDVTLSTSAFNARYDNPLSSVFQFTQRDGNQERLQGNVRLSATDLATTFDGPIASGTTFLASARRSYLQFLFQAIDLPIRPNYWDFQYKLTHRINPGTTITSLGVGAIDEFSFAVPKESTPEKEYVLRSNPSINQKNYTIGFLLKKLISRGYVNVVLSRNFFYNSLDKFEDGQTGDEDLRTLRIRSAEIENKLRLEVNKSGKGWKYSYGASAQYVQFRNEVFNKLRKEILDSSNNVIQPEVRVAFNTTIDFLKFGAFAQASKMLFNDRLSITTGIRSDINSFTSNGDNPAKTFSPRINVSYALNSKWNINATAGRYYKIPIYTVLGFQDGSGEFVNRDSEYIRSVHYAAGAEFLPSSGLRFTLEGFYKLYTHYPVSVRDEISLANQGGDFGAIGNEETASNGKGRTFGAELFAQQKLTKNTFFIVSYTLYKSEFSGSNGDYISSSWDNRNLISLLVGRKFKKNWEAGIKFRYAGGAPYTPFDAEASRRNYLSTGTGIPDVSAVNTEKLEPFRQFDLRIDKKWNFRQLTVDVFLDVQNLFLFRSPAYPNYTFTRNADNTGYLTNDGEAIEPDGSNAIPIILKNDDPTVLPTIGFIVEF